MLWGGTVVRNDFRRSRRTAVYGSLVPDRLCYWCCGRLLVWTEWGSKDREVSEHLVPMVVEESNRGDRAYDIYSRLLKDNIVFIGESIDDSISNLVVAQLLFLEADDPDRDISIYINAPGGSVTAGLAIYDTMQFIRPDITTICVGQAASMAAVLLAAGTKGKRFALPNSRIVIHQPVGGVSGPASDVEIHAREILRMRALVNDILVSDTGQDPDRIGQDTDRDFIMTADEALEYGLIDQIIRHRTLLKAT